MASFNVTKRVPRFIANNGSFIKEYQIKERLVGAEAELSTLITVTLDISALRSQRIEDYGDILDSIVQMLDMLDT